MNCTQMGDRLLDLASGIPGDAETAQHLQTCDVCAEKLASLAQTMSLLDEWQTPEPSPYFDTRLHARLRGEAAKPAAGWLGWFRKPALALSMASLMALGVTLVGLRSGPGEPGQSARNVIFVDAPKGSAIADLESLDKNHDLLANFDLLDDDDANGGDTTANP
jgi:anti-sigma factor RsiW